MTPDPSIAESAIAFLRRQGGWYSAREVAAGIDCDLAEAREALVALADAGDLESREFRQPAAYRPGLPRAAATNDAQWRVIV